MLKLDRGSLSAIYCGAKEKMRYALNSLRITNRECIATDGRRLIVVKHPEQGTDGEDAVDFIPRNVYREDVEVALKGLSRKQRDPDYAKEVHVAVRESNENGSVHVSVPVGVAQRASIQLNDVEGTFPEWEDVVPRSDDFTVGVCINGSYLKDILKVVAEVNKARGRGEYPEKIIFKLKLPTNKEPGHMQLSPVLIESCSGDVRAALMPISVE